VSAVRDGPDPASASASPQDGTGGRATAGALLVVVAGVMPIHLTGALAPELQRDLGFGDAWLGVLIALSFGVSAVAAAPGGAFTDRAGPRIALRVGAAFSAAGALALAGAPNLALLALALVVAAPGNGISQGGSNVLIAEGVKVERRGVALGVKQSAVSVSTATSGIVSLVVVASLGWRWAYAVVVVVAAVAAVVIPEVRRGRATTPVAPAAPASARESRIDAGVVRAAALTGFAGAAAVASIGTFLVRSAEAADLSASTGRLVLTGGSILLIVMRIGWGAVADTGKVDPARIVVILLVGGTLGYLLLSTGTLAGFVVGAALAFGAGWAWPGLLFLALVRRFPTAAGRPSGQVQRGMFLGAMIGPFLFGVVADAVSFTAAWWMSAAWGLVAAAAAVGFLRASDVRSD
jgi:predicted MFS family arabinose efflux permease